MLASRDAYGLDGDILLYNELDSIKPSVEVRPRQPLQIDLRLAVAIGGRSVGSDLHHRPRQPVIGAPPACLVPLVAGWIAVADAGHAARTADDSEADVVAC